MSDVVDRLQMAILGESFTAKLLGDAANEIKRLRLTDAERDAVFRAELICERAGLEKTVATLCGLRERTK